MNSDTGYFKLGLFVIVGVALIVAGIVVFGAGELFQNYVRGETFTTQSVEGLVVGAAVKYSGVTVGKVSEIGMAWWDHRDAPPEQMADIRRYIKIGFEIRRDAFPAKTSEEMRRNLADNIKRGMRVRMASSGLTGPPYLEMVFVDPAENPVPELTFVARDSLYVPSAPSEVTQIVDHVHNLLAQLKRSDLEGGISDLRKLVRDTDKSLVELDLPEMRRRLAATLDDLQGTTQRVHEILKNPKVQTTIDNSAAFSADLPKLSAQLRQITTRIETIVNDPKVQRLLDESAPAAADLRRILKRIESVIAGQSGNLDAILISLRRILENGSSLVDDARHNPSRVIFGEPPPRLENGESR